MAKDHYVAVTYLKHFIDSTAGDMLNAYSKKSDKQFKCFPKDVCREDDGDTNTMFSVNPELLGNFRSIFEPQWNQAIAAFLDRKNTHQDKLVVSAYMANLMVVTPTWQRIGALTYAKNMQGTLEFKRQLHNEGVMTLDELMLDGIDMLSRGDLKLEVDTDYVKGIATKQLMNYALLIYNIDWCLLVNKTAEKFVTSDSPVAVQSLGTFSGSIRRYLPLTPELCLVIELHGHKHKLIEEDKFTEELVKPPKGKIKPVPVTAGEVRAINVMQVKSAENLVFSSVASDGIAKVTKKYSKHKLDVDYREFPSPDGNGKYQGVQICVREVT